MHSNHDNRSFYEMSPLNFNTMVAKSAGLSSNPDIDLLYKHLECTMEESVIDLGAAEGRVIECLIQKNYPGQIAAVEYAYLKYKLLKDKFSHEANVSIIYDDMMNLDGSYDHGFLLFSVIMDFNRVEQQNLVLKLDRMIRQKIFIDMPKFNAQINGTYLPNQMAVIQMEWGRLDGFFPKKEDLLAFFSKTAFQLQAIESYITDTDRERELFVFSK